MKFIRPSPQKMMDKVNSVNRILRTIKMEIQIKSIFTSDQSRRSSQESISSSVFHSDSFTPPNATPKMTLSGEMHKQETGTVGQSLSSGERNNSQTGADGSSS
jgi:hypothetical protein